MRRRLILAVSLIAACERGTGANDRDTSTNPSDSLHWDTAISGAPITDDRLIAEPYQVRVLDDDQIAVVDASSPFVHIVSRASGRRTVSLGRYGRDSGELMSVRSVATQPGAPGVLWAHDLQQRLLLQIVKPRGMPYQQPISLPKVGGAVIGADHPIWITDTEMIFAAVTDSTSIGILNTVTGRTRVLGQSLAEVSQLVQKASEDAREWPLDSLTWKLAASETRLCVDPDHKWLVRVFRTVDRVDIVSLAGLANSGVVHRGTDQRIKPIAEADSQRRVWHFSPGSQQQRFAYLGCVATSTKILALYSGRLTRDGPRASIHGVYLREFDYTGDITGVRKLSHAIATFDITPSGDAIIGVSYDPAPAVLQFPLGEPN